MAPAHDSRRTRPTVYFKNAVLLDGTGREPRPGGLVVQDGRIKDVGHLDPEPAGDDVEVIDLAGRTLMPGMVLAHVHLGYDHVTELPDAGRVQPPEEATIAAVRAARAMLDSGFTAGISAGGLYRVDIHVRDAINAGRLPGPRLLAAGRDLCQTGGMHDCGTGATEDGSALLVDGPWEVRRAVRRLIREGADLVTMCLTGDGLLRCRQTEVTCTQEEVTALTEEAHRRERPCAVQARTAEACKMAARAGVDVINHAAFLDDEALDRVAEAGCFLVPALDYLVTTLEHAQAGGFARMGSYNEFLDRTLYEAELDAAVEAVTAAQRRGIRVLVGGDFGFAWCPHGSYARELTHLVHLAGCRPMDVLVAATRQGAAAMGLQDRIGTLEPGKFADLVVVEGNPLHDIALLEDVRNICYVMKGGQFFRQPGVAEAAACTPVG
jgi:imidazolonepropionase-like amidohydrolase